MKTRKKLALAGYKPLFERLYSMGVDTPWERYEKALPQNRLASTGFFCHSVCLDGPCHVDPFGNGVTQGVCGRTALEMASSWLLTTAARGFVRRARDVSKITNEGGQHIPAEVMELVEMTALPRLDSRRVAVALKQAALAIASMEIDAAPGELPARAGSVRCGLGARNPLKPAILLDGLDPTTMKCLQDQFAQTGIECLVTADERTGFRSGLPVLCPSSIASVVALGGCVDAVVAGERSYLREGACREVEGAARIFSNGGLEVADVVSSARRHFAAFTPVPAPASCAAWDEQLPAGDVLILAGGLGVKRTCGEVTGRLAQVAIDAGFEVMAFGDAAAVLGEHGLLGMEGGSGAAVPCDNPSGLGWAMSLVKAKAFAAPPVVAFPEAVISSDLAAALEFAALGAVTFFGSALPIAGPGLPAALGWDGGDGLPLLCSADGDTPESVFEKLRTLRRNS